MDIKAQIEKKELPFSVSKAQLVDMYITQMSREMICDNANEIIYDNRKKMKKFTGLSRQIIIRTHFLTHVEFVEFIDVFGTPKGYYKPDNF